MSMAMTQDPNYWRYRFHMFGLYSRNSHSFHVVNQGPNVHRAPPCGESEESRSSTVMKKMHSPESSPLLGGLGKIPIDFYGVLK